LVPGIRRLACENLQLRHWLSWLHLVTLRHNFSCHHFFRPPCPARLLFSSVSNQSLCGCGSFPSANLLHRLPPLSSLIPLYPPATSATTRPSTTMSSTVSLLRKLILESPPGEWAINQLRELLIGSLKQGPVPQHVAFEMDGNRRYARTHRMETVEGHHRGFEALARVSL
jgi:hypothetical protein